MTKLYSTKDAFDIYVYYLALKRHFTSDYDFHKYNGKVKANVMSFENRKDKFFFYKLSKKPDAKELILANMLVDPGMWIGDMLEDKAQQNHNERLKRIQSLSRTFQLDLNELNEDFDSNILVEGGQHPRILQLFNQRRICLETLVILNGLTKCFRYWSKNISDTIVFPSINKLVNDYSPFLEYDQDKMRRIVVDKFKHTS
jgi:hypothetical protein